MKHIPYGKQHIDRKDIEEVCKVLKSDWITQGPMIEEFEKRLCMYTGAKYAVAVSNGTAALHIACLAAGISSGDEVITSPITFVASANSVLYCGGRPVFADVHEYNANIDPDDIKKKITSNTRAIIPVHFSGHPCDLDRIRKLAEENNLIIIEDAAHALGAKYKGSTIGSCKYSDMTILSFHPVKHITTGEGGMVLTNRKDIYEKLLLFRNHGITKEKVRINKSVGPWYYEQQLLGYNYRITDFQCALGVNQLKKLDNFIIRRREIVDTYNDELSKYASDISLPVEESEVVSSWHLYCIRLRNSAKRLQIFKKLHEMGIGVQVHYIPVYWHPYYKKLGYKKGICPKSESYYQCTITIPLHPSMKTSDVKYVVNAISKVFINRKGKR